MGKVRKRFYIGINVVLLAFAVYFSLFRFQSVLIRTFQSLRDLVLSLGYFCYVPGIKPTVAEIPTGVGNANVPVTWAEMQAKISEAWSYMWDKQHFFEYLAAWLYAMLRIANAILPAVIIIAATCGLLSLMYKPKKKKKRKGKKKKSHARGKKNKARASASASKPLQWFERFESKWIAPIKKFVVGYFKYLKTKKGIRAALILIWLYNLNFFTVVIEVFAWLFYIGRNSKFSSIYSQFVKLVGDLSIPLDFLPLIIEIILGAWIFHAIRCAIARKRLRNYIKKIEAWLDKVLGSIYIIGKQRARKTTLLTVLALLEAARYRKMAKKALKRRAKQFPNFPWRNLEKTIREMRKRHTVYNLARTKEFTKELHELFKKNERRDAKTGVKNLDFLHRRGYRGDNFMFGYNYKRYPTKYKDGARIVDVWNAIEAYAQLYFIYSTPTPFGFGNYSVRFDEKRKTVGNFEKYDLDFINRKPEDMKKDSQYAHVLDWDFCRTGTLMDPEGLFKDAFEYGVIIATEFEKEVGNQKTQEGEKKDSKQCNRKNDGLSEFVKTVTHMATVDNDTYVRFLCDGHRQGSASADFMDLFTIWRITKRSDSKIVLPLFAFEEAAYLLCSKFYDWLEDKLSYNKGKKTLFQYLIEKIYMPFHRYHDRIKSKYSVYTSTVDMWDGADNESIKKGAKITVPEFLAFTDRFATDALGAFFHEKAKKSPTGINDVPMYQTKQMSFAEMGKGHSHFYNKLGERGNVENFLQLMKEREQQIKEWERREKERKEQDAA